MEQNKVTGILSIILGLIFIIFPFSICFISSFVNGSKYSLSAVSKSVLTVSGLLLMIISLLSNYH